MIANLDDYKVFYYVAITGNMARSAAMLVATPPTITRSIQALETALQCRLFTRARNGVQLTAAGSALFQRIKPAIESLNQGLSNIQSGSLAFSSEITVGLVPFSLPNTVISLCLPAFREACPTTRVHLVNVDSNSIEEKLLSREVDLVITGTTKANPSLRRCELRPVLTDYTIPVISSAYDADAFHSLEELAQLPLIFAAPGKRLYPILSLYYQQQGLSFAPAITVTNTDQQIAAVEAGLGYTFLPYGMVMAESKKGLLLPVNIPFESPTNNIICIVAEKERTLSPAARTFYEIVVEQFKQLGAEPNRFLKQKRLQNDK